MKRPTTWFWTLSGLDRSLYLSAAISMLLAIGAATWSALAHRPPEQYAIGERVGTIPNIDFSSSPSTILLWLDSKCAACSRSMDALTRVAAAARLTKVVAVGRQHVEQLEDYAIAYKLRLTGAVSVGDMPLKFRGTPTVMLVSADSVVEGVWFGVADIQAGEGTIVRMLK